MQLHFDPLLDAHPSNFFDIALARAESQAVQRLLDLLFGRELALEAPAGVGGGGSGVCGERSGQKQAFDLHCRTSLSLQTGFSLVRLAKSLQPIDAASGGFVHRWPSERPDMRA